MKPNEDWIIAGTLSLMTALIHIIAGQLDFVNPLAESSLEVGKRAHWIGEWHLVSIVLILMSYVTLSAALGKKYAGNPELIKLIGYLNLAFCIPFIIASLYYGLWVLQWILFLMTGVFILKGFRKQTVED